MDEMNQHSLAVAAAPEATTTRNPQDREMEDLARHLRCEGVDKKLMNMRFYCPAHEDTDFSLSLVLEKKGRIRMYCDQGCSKDEIIRGLNCKGTEQLHQILARTIQRMLVILAEGKWCEAS